MYTLVRCLPIPQSPAVLPDRCHSFLQLDTCLNKIDIPTYLARVVQGLSDADEIQGPSDPLFQARATTDSPRWHTVICFLSLARLAQVAPAAVTQILDNIAPNFAETMKAFVGGKDTVKQDFDRKVRLLPRPLSPA